MANFKIIDFLNALNNNIAAKNALEKILSVNKNNDGSTNKSAKGKERLRPNGENHPIDTNLKTYNGSTNIKTNPSVSHNTLRYSNKYLIETIKRHDAISKEIDERECKGNSHLTFKEKAPLSLPKNTV